MSINAMPDDIGYLKISASFRLSKIEDIIDTIIP